MCIVIDININQPYLFKPGASAEGQCVPGFLELLLSANVCMLVCVFACVCVPPRLLITSGVMWCNIDPI